MKINNLLPVKPPKSRDVDLNKAFGAVLGKISDDDVQAIVFLEAEVRVVRDIRQRWLALDEELSGDIDDFENIRAQLAEPIWEPVRQEGLELVRVDHVRVADERRLASAQISWCDAAIAELTDPDSRAKLMAGYRAGGPRNNSALRLVHGSFAALRHAQARLAAADARWDEAADDLSKRTDARNAFAATSDSVTLARIDALSPDGLEEMTAWLLKRDGCTIVRGKGGAGDKGADVIAIAPDGRRVVVQCKHSTRPRYRLEPRFLYELNGVARPIHNADVTAIVTNRAVSADAEYFAADQGIHIVDRRALKLWATYGVPWLPPGDSRTETVTAAGAALGHQAA